MVQTTIFKIINDGEIAIQLYNPATDLEELLHVFREGFMKDSTMFIAFEMNKPEAAQYRLEYEGLIPGILQDGLSVIARHLPTMKIIGFCLNQLQSHPEGGQPTFYEAFHDSSETIVRKLLDFRIGKVKQMNLFEMYETEHIFETSYLGILPEYRSRGIGYHLFECSIKIAREIANEKYPMTMIDGIKGKKPKIIFCSSSSEYSRKIAEKLNFAEVKRFPFEELKVNGVSFSEKIPPQHTHFAMCVFKL
ncbi:uncharacterized protein LOC129788080 [Lutzomyia longipalpis]|uniref:uncharacterized protein LOC129788080 n=1 Tax=Lutzomyia longipalpis TaxID=7200 RepID=UPI002484723C|nr:uncharacterized protein LOC129788080 [Lutzomyia longipalpis]